MCVINHVFDFKVIEVSPSLGSRKKCQSFDQCCVSYSAQKMYVKKVIIKSKLDQVTGCEQ